jgi:SNF2 family DNA or RNA helicase
MADASDTMKPRLKTEWAVIDDYLALKCSDGSTLIPSGIDIFQAEYRGKNTILDLEVARPSKTFSHIGFSKYPLRLSIAVKASEDPSRGLLSMEVRGERDKSLIPVKDPLLRIADHIIHDGTWYAFEKGSLLEVKNLIARNGVTKGYTLTFQQFFHLLTSPSEIVPVSVEFDVHSVPSLAGFEKVPASFKGNLYPYQGTGYRWLRMIYKEGLGCILGDEMGLGKTIQIICLIARNVENKERPSLIVAPATLLENWRREFAKFSPCTNIYVHIGSERTGFPADLEKFDVVITSFSTLARDLSLFKMVTWDIIVADEAQAIKNPEAERTKVLKSLPRKTAIAVTGTPVQNTLTDLWSIMDFVLPDLLGERIAFEKKYQNSVEGASDLEPLVTPVILRRTVSEVAKDLPPKIDIPQPMEMPSDMAQEYERIRQKTLEECDGAPQLVTLQKLRMFCTHPFLVNGERADPAENNPKYQRLLEIVEEIFANKEQVLIFTSFTHMIDMLLADLPKRFGDVWMNFIDGRVPVSERQPRVDEFNNCAKPAALILNPAAAGVGLNLTAANHVIHYNLEWNPAVEDQASARAHRIGQKKPVTVHRLYFADSVEEVINDRVDFKRDLAETTVRGVDGENRAYSDILRAMQMTPVKAA